MVYDRASAVLSPSLKCGDQVLDDPAVGQRWSEVGSSRTWSSQEALGSHKNLALHQFVNSHLFGATGFLFTSELIDLHRIPGMANKRNWGISLKKNAPPLILPHFQTTDFYPTFVQEK